MAAATNFRDEQNPPPPPVSTRFRRKVNLETILKRKLNLDFIPKENVAIQQDPLPVEDEKFAFYKYMGTNAPDVVPSLYEDVEDSTQDADREGFTPLALPRVVIEHLENDPHTKQALTCQVCCNLMQPPIYSCPSGHSACAECKRYLTMCPKALCLGQFSSRHFTLEKVWNSLKINCQDCGASIAVNAWDDHEKICKESWSDL